MYLQDIIECVQNISLFLRLVHECEEVLLLLLFSGHRGPVHLADYAGQLVSLLPSVPGGGLEVDLDSVGSGLALLL